MFSQDKHGSLSRIFRAQLAAKAALTVPASAPIEAAIGAEAVVVAAVVVGVGIVAAEAVAAADRQVDFRAVGAHLGLMVIVEAERRKLARFQIAESHVVVNWRRRPAHIPVTGRSTLPEMCLMEESSLC